jgi:peptidoglycan/LPS O-acetylase OafA/YrhL
VRLSDYAVGRDNNFNLLRLLAALTVIYAHSFAVLGRSPDDIVTLGQVGVSLSDLAVDVFFVTSGFLVTGSLVNRGSLIKFIWARALRIYPALWVMLALTVFILAPALTSWPLADYLTSPKTHEYFAKDATLLGGVRWSLPGVFDSLPLRGEFNGSLWTLPVELRLYLYLAAAWLVLSLTQGIRLKAMALIAPVAAVILFVDIVRGKVFGAPFNPADIRIYMFVSGAALYLWRDKVPLGVVPLLAILAALAAAALDRSAFLVAYLILLGPLIMHLAYLPKGPIRAVNGWGDFSYGVYIYGFPVQQTLVFLFPAVSLTAMVVSASGASLIIGALSWFLLEKRALALKDAAAAATLRVLQLNRAKPAMPATR